jgi:hypothetical protein
MLDVFEIRPKVASKSSSSYYNNLVQRKQNILMLEFVPAEGRQFTCSTSHLLFHLNRRLTSLTTFFGGTQTISTFHFYKDREEKRKQVCLSQQLLARAIIPIIL